MIFNLVARHRPLLTAPSYNVIPSCSGRYLPPGALYIPYNERFDENCDPIPKMHPETSRFMETKTKPNIPGKRPVQVICKPGQIYWWCSCGYSRSQPFCDGSHVKVMGPTPQFKIYKRLFKPVRLQFDKPTEVWFCMCKQTKEPPYCDGSHDCEEVQKAVKF